MRPPRATLTAEAIDGSRQLVVDCPHGRTVALYANGTAPGAPALTDTDVVRVLLVRHALTEGCRCTRRLRRRMPSRQESFTSSPCRAP